MHIVSNSSGLFLEASNESEISGEPKTMMMNDEFITLLHFNICHTHISPHVSTLVLSWLVHCEYSFFLRTALQVFMNRMYGVQNRRTSKEVLLLVENSYFNYLDTLLYF